MSGNSESWALSCDEIFVHHENILTFRDFDMALILDGEWKHVAHAWKGLFEEKNPICLWSRSDQMPQID